MIFNVPPAVTSAASEMDRKKGSITSHCREDELRITYVQNGGVVLGEDLIISH
jgi:hypothetical protein